MGTIRTNIVTLAGNYLIKPTYIPGTFLLTDGQPSDGVPFAAGPGTSVDFVVKCGRHKSMSVGSDFWNHCDKKAIAPQPSSGNIPSELNFCFNVACDFILNNEQTMQAVFWIAQGSDLTTNNWYFGSSDLTPSSRVSGVIPLYDANGQIGRWVNVQVVNTSQINFT